MNNKKTVELTVPLLVVQALSTTLECKSNDCLISSDKELAKIVKTIGNTDLQLPLRRMNLAQSVMVCLEILANTVKPSQLARHGKTKHLEHEEKPLQFFQ